MKRIAIIPNEYKDSDFEVAKKIVAKLSEAGFPLFIPNEFKRHLKGEEEITFMAEKSVFRKSDICIVLGGDGSILKNAAMCAEFDCEMLGVNLGYIGYMTALEASQAGRIVQFIQSDYTVERRMMLDVNIMRGAQVIYESPPVLNDAVISKSKGYGVIETSVYGQGKLINKYRGDGVIVSTPTGSTAYSLSAGGPIIDSTLDCICITPICAHSLKSRPIVFGSNSDIELVCSSNINRSCVTLDGRTPVQINDGDLIRVRTSDKRLKLIRTKGQSFCNTFYEKLSDI